MSPLSADIVHVGCNSRDSELQLMDQVSVSAYVTEMLMKWLN